MTSPIRLSERQLHAIMTAARTVPLDLRDAFLKQVAAELRGRDLGDGLVHRVAYQVARAIIWEAEQTAFG
jgi:hypothetical protein